MNQTKIEWCDVTWNPVTGCLHGCPYCYARTIAHRFGTPYGNTDIHEIFGQVKDYSDAVHSGPFPYEFAPTLHRYRLDEPFGEDRPKNIFAVSMGDLFGNWVPDEWIRQVFAACERAPWHRYLFLTKNPAGIDSFIENDSNEERGFSESIEFFSPFWFGASITDDADLERVEILSDLREGHHFLSIEPLLGPVHINLIKSRCPKCGSDEIYEDNPRTRGDASPIYCDDCGWEGTSRDELKPGIEWVIIGAETGNRKEKVIPQRSWVEEIVQSCRTAGIPVFMKNSLSKVWGAPLVQEFPWKIKTKEGGLKNGL